jgi:biotin carboxyl carrier protein
LEYQYEYNDSIYTVRLEQQADGSLSATIGDQTYQVKLYRQYPGEVQLRIDGKPLKAFFATDPATANHPAQQWVSLGDSITYAVTRVEASGRRRGSRAGSAGNLTAQMPGQVTDVVVAEGDAVESGQTLLIMEAMKMEIRVTAPADGIVKQLHVQKGDTVDRGQQLIEIGAADTD